jgi:hypothetical protein
MRRQVVGPLPNEAEAVPAEHRPHVELGYLAEGVDGAVGEDLALDITHRSIVPPSVG